MTPLQALEIVKGLGQRYTELDNEYIEACDVLEKSLTPPTSDEVCEAIKEDTGFEIEYKYKTFANVNGVVYTTYDGKIRTNLSLTPKTFTLIGRFYEAQE